MKYWLIAMCWGSKGDSLWPDCFKQGIAAIGYWDDRGEPIEDCSELTEAEYDDMWRRRWPRSGTARSSLRKVVYQMKKGDIIYVKEGSNIVGKGTIIKEYQYDPNILREIRFNDELGLIRRNECDPDIFKEAKHIWGHFVTVNWEINFQPFKLWFEGTQRSTVVKLNGERLSEINKMENSEKSLAFKAAVETEELEIIEEGIERYKSEAMFRSRNYKLIEEKKSRSDYHCEVCNMRFVDIYGEIGEKYIIAHHIKPIGHRKNDLVTKIDDVALVCSNCHDMLHRKDPPLGIGDLKYLLIK